MNSLYDYNIKIFYPFLSRLPGPDTKWLEQG